MNLPFRNSNQLNKIIDEEIPGRPHFKHEEIIVGGEAFDIYFRNIIECIQALFGDPEFAPFLVFVPERHYVAENKTVRRDNDRNTGKW